MPVPSVGSGGVWHAETRRRMGREEEADEDEEEKEGKEKKWKIENQDRQ